MSALYHFSCWMYSGLDELWVVSGKCDSINVTPVLTIVNGMDNSVADVLPAVHALTSKVDTKCAVFQVAMKCDCEI